MTRLLDDHKRLRLLDPRRDDAIVAEFGCNDCTLPALVAAAGSADWLVVVNGWCSSRMPVTLINETTRECATMPPLSSLSDLLLAKRTLQWPDEHVIEVDADPWARREGIVDWSFDMGVWDWVGDWEDEQTTKSFVRTVASVITTMHTDRRVTSSSLASLLHILEFTGNDLDIDGDQSYYDVTPWIQPPRKTTQSTSLHHLDYIRRMRAAYRIVEGHV